MLVKLPEKLPSSRKMLPVILLTFAIASGQLIKIPVFSGGISLLDITVILLIFLSIINYQLSIKTLPLWVKTGILFIIIATLSLMLTPLELETSEYLNSFLYTVRLSLYLLFGYLCLNSKPKPNFQKSLILSGIILAILGLLQFILFPDLSFLSAFGWDPHYFRLVSTFLDPNFIGAYLVLTLLLVIPVKTAVHTKSLRANKAEVVIFTIVFLSLLLTFSRSSYLMFTVSFVTLATLQKSFRLFFLTLILTAVLFSGFFIYTKTISEPHGIDREKSASFRLNTWQEGLGMFTHSPILGVGFNSYKFGLSQYQLASENFLKTHGATTNDSSLLFVLATTGLVGIVAYLGFLFTLAKAKRNIIFTAALAGLLIHSIFANSLFYPPILLWLLLI